MSQMTRRKFIGSTAMAGTAFAISGTKSSGRILRANDTIRIGVAGLNGRGGSHVGAWLGMEDVQIAYLIDPDTRTFARHLKSIERKNKPTPKTVQDVRAALDDKDLDAISIATPN